jgi:hypothetical protein
MLAVQRDRLMLPEIEAGVSRDIENAEKQTQAEVTATKESNELMDNALDHLRQCRDDAFRRLSAIYLHEDVVVRHHDIARSLASDTP